MSEDVLNLPPPPPADARLAYGPHASQFGDLRVPGGPGPHPVLVMVHGGFWRARYDLTHLGYLCAALTQAGFATWSLEYRKLGEEGGGWPGTFHDAAAGAAHLSTIAAAHHLDLQRVVTMGHSAGGHLALWLAGRRRLPPAHPFEAIPVLPVRGVVALAAVSDLRRASTLNLSNGVVRELLAGDPTSVPERYAAASPAELLPLDVPQVLVHGTEDDTVPYALSVSYQQAATGAGDAVRLVTLPEMGHYEPIDPRSAAFPKVVDAVRMLLE